MLFRSTILFDDSDQAECVTKAEVVNASYYGDMTYYSIKLPELEKPATVSMRNTAGRSIVPAGTNVRIGWGADSVVLFS